MRSATYRTVNTIAPLEI